MIVQADFKALEWVTALELSQDSIGIQEYIDGIDLHAENQTLLKLPERRIAKIFLFRLIYGGTGYSYAHDNNFNHVSSNVKYWDRLIEQFYSKYVGLYKWHTRIFSDTARNGQLVIPTGRIYRFSPQRDRKGELKWPRTKILNYPVQGYAAELVKIARILLYEYLNGKGLNHGLLISSVHDSLVVDCPNEDTERTCEALHHIIHDLTSRAFERVFSTKFSLPLRGEITFGYNQKETEEWYGP